MKYAIIALVIVVIMHDISITRLHRKVVTLQAFFNDVVQRLEDLKYNSSKPTEKEFTAYDSAKMSHNCIGIVKNPIKTTQQTKRSNHDRD